jgi:hypothetical protein
MGARGKLVKLHVVMSHVVKLHVDKAAAVV